MLEEDEFEVGACDCCRKEDLKSNLIVCPEHFEELEHNCWRNFEYCKECCKDYYDEGECEAYCEEEFILDHIESKFREFCESKGFRKFDDSSYINSNGNIVLSPNKFVDKFEKNPIFVESPFLVSDYAVMRHKDTLYIYDRKTYEYLYNLLKVNFRETPSHIIQSEKQTTYGSISLLKLEGYHISGIITPIDPSPFIERKLKDKSLEYIEKGIVTLNLETEVGEFLKENVNNHILNTSIEQNNIFVSRRKKDVIRIATVQLDFKLSSSFPYKVTDKDKMIEKVYKSLKMANENKVDIICFPELSFCEEWLQDVQNQNPDMIIVAGSYYNSMNNNTCQILFGSDGNFLPQLKILPSAPEKGEYAPRMVSGECVNIYESRFGIFAVLICRDFPFYVPHLRNKVDIVFVPSFNRDLERFYSAAHNHVENSHSYVIISNSSEFGGTSIFGIEDRSIFDQLVEMDYKTEGDDTYRLCEIKEDKEGIIIADFNLSYMRLQKPTPTDPHDEIKPVKIVNRIYL